MKEKRNKKKRVRQRKRKHMLRREDRENPQWRHAKLWRFKNYMG